MSEIRDIKTDFLLPNKLKTDDRVKYNRVEGEKLDFGEILKEAVNSVNNAQLNADSAVKKVLQGETQNIHETMIVLQKAETSLQMLLEVRNRLLEAYQEIMRTQL
ncbi:MAG: flagellar hook-basal body complex protein FliE [Deferribacterota bacterium]|nr:flagellar hook-basal body complex protein FliE [Deferribacterota bacterium]